MDITSLIISLISGAVGGNVAGAALKDQSLGTLGNSLAGILGGGVGSVILQALGVLAAGGGVLDLGTIRGNIASGGVGGGLLMVIIGLLKGALARA
jgi:uncharacterized membrane protein YeaQ/YmgE (transglycosylase-associated protein family)